MDSTNNSMPNSNPVPGPVPPTDSNDVTMPTSADAAPASLAAQPSYTNDTGGVPVSESYGTLSASKESAQVSLIQKPNATKKKNNITLIVLVVVFLLATCAVSGIFIFQLMSSNGSSGGTSSSGGTDTVAVDEMSESSDSTDDPDNPSGNNSSSPTGGSNISEGGALQSRPTLELAELVCNKYGGELEVADSSELYTSELYYCMGKAEAYYALSNGSQFAISFIDSGEKDETWSKIRSDISNSDGHEDVSGYVILENSDTFIKAYVAVSGLARAYIVAYDNAIAEVSASSDHAVEEILKELGFPDGKRADDYK